MLPRPPIRLSVATVLLAAVPALAASPFPITLSDPVSGATTTIRAEGRLTHVVLMATWCPRCVDELVELRELEGRWSRQGYRLVLIAVSNRQDPERLTRFAEDRDPPGVLLFDADERAQRALGASSVPTHVLYGAEGNELMRAHALDDELQDEIERRLGRGRNGS